MVVFVDHITVVDYMNRCSIKGSLPSRNLRTRLALYPCTVIILARNFNWTLRERPRIKFILHLYQLKQSRRARATSDANQGTNIYQRWSVLWEAFLSFCKVFCFDDAEKIRNENTLQRHYSYHVVMRKHKTRCGPNLECVIRRLNKDDDTTIG